MSAHKGYHGWFDEDTVAIEGDRAIRITTMKRSDGVLKTIATVGSVDGFGFSTIIFKDFNQVLMNSTPSRVTQKVVEAQHREAMTKLPELKEAINSYYAAKKD